MSDVAVPARLSGVVASHQLTVIPVTVAVLEIVKLKVTVCPVLAGLGETFVIATVGGLTVTTITVIV